MSAAAGITAGGGTAVVASGHGLDHLTRNHAAQGDLLAVGDTAGDGPARLVGHLPDLLTVIAPRDPGRGDDLAVEIRRRGFRLAQRSRCRLPDAACEVLLADTLDELGLFYRLARVALVGGSLVPHGGQNPLEPARLGCPVLLGPHTHNFAEIAARLVQAGAARRVADSAELARTLAALLPDRAGRAEMAARGLALADAVAGAGRETLAKLGPLLDRTLADAGA